MTRSVDTSKIQPTYPHGFARSAGESAHPEKWKGLIGLWSAGLGPTGGSLFDISRKNNGVWNGTGSHWLVSDGRYTGQYNGSDDYNDLGDDLFDANTRGAIYAWINGSDFSGDPRIFSSASQTGSLDFLDFFVDTTAGAGSNMIAIIDRTNLDHVSGSTSLTTGRWYFVVVTSDGSSWSLYVDGEPESLTVEAGTNAGGWFAAVDIGVNEYNIGDLARSTGHTAFFNGLIDEVGLYDRPPLASELQEFYQLGRGGILQRKPIVLAKASVAPAGGGQVGSIFRSPVIRAA